MTLLWLIYLAGAAVALWRTDGSAATKIACAILWPVGAIAGLVTVGGLVMFSLIAFPAVGAVVVAAAALAWLLVR